MSCAPTPIEIVVSHDDVVEISPDDFENARELLKLLGDDSDPTLDEIKENIANGNNSTGITGVQFPPPVQSTEPERIDQRPEAADEKTPPASNGQAVSCTTWDGDYNFQLSPNFKVRDFTIGYSKPEIDTNPILKFRPLFRNQLTDLGSLTKEERCCNLQNLAMNIAEPLLARFGPFHINSALRNNIPQGGSPTSQHLRGQAMDVQFPGWNYEMYWRNAVWVRDNLPYDQFIYEHSSATGLVWYHLSYNPIGNRPASDRFKCCTMYRNKYSPGLLRFG